MAPVVNDKIRFIASITDNITLFCRLALKYNKKIKVDGCLAVTIDDENTIIVNLSETIVGGNTNSIYPSLRVNGRDGQTYVLLKDSSANPSTASKTTPRTTCSQPTTPVLAGRPTTTSTVSSTQFCQVLKTAGSAHLLIKPQTPSSPSGQPQQQRASQSIIIVSPSKDQASYSHMQSLITGRRFATKTTSTSTSTSTSDVVASTSSLEQQSNMSTRNSKVLQARVLPELSQIEQVPAASDVKPEPEEDPAYGQTQNLSTQITQFFCRELEEASAPGACSQDKENSSSSGGSGSRRSSTSTDCSAAKQRRTNSSIALPNPQPAVEMQNARQTVESPRRKSFRIHESIAGGGASNFSRKKTSDEPSGKEQVTSITSTNAELPSIASPSSIVLPSEETAAQDASTSDEECESEDDALSIATSEEEAEKLYRCSQKFASDCTKKVKRLDDMLASLKNDMVRIGKESTKKNKTKFTRSANLYQRALQDFGVAKSKGSRDIKGTERKLEKDLGTVLDHFESLKEMILRILNKGSNKSPTRCKASPTKKLLKKKAVSSGVKHTTSVVRKLHTRARESNNTRVARMCGDCASCKREVDCGNCRFCMDKVKYGGSNTLRQKCIRKQCVNKGLFMTVRAKGATVLKARR